MICSIQEPRSGEPYDRCPRSLAQKALKYLESTGIADTAFFGPEPEFFLFDDVRYDSKEGSCFYSVDTIEAPWNTGRIEEGGNLGYKIQYKEGYFPVAPNDTAQDIRSEMLLLMGELGIPTEKHHHEVAGAGQHELGMKFDSLINSADNVMTYKYVVRNVAKNMGKLQRLCPSLYLTIMELECMYTKVYGKVDSHYFLVKEHMQTYLKQQDGTSVAYLNMHHHS